MAATAESDRETREARVDALLPSVEDLMRGLAHGQGRDPLGGIVDEHLATGGKRIRARLALHAVGALGGEVLSSVPWAAACELLHNATLIHDDIQDGDRTRRGKPAVWVNHGAPQAINAGDLMLMLPYQAVGKLAGVAVDVKMALVDALTRHTVATVRGQAVEIALPSRRHDGDLREPFTDGVRGKTSALFVLPIEGAALLAGRTSADAALLAEPFAQLGVLFQLQDDVLDLYGDKGRDAPGSDLCEGKVSSLVVEHLALRPDDGAWLWSVLDARRDDTRDDDVKRAIRDFRASGALDNVLAEIRRLSTSLLENKALVAEPLLHALAAEFVALVLGPIDHELERSTSSR